MAHLIVERALWHLAARQPERGLAELDRIRSYGDPPLPPAIEGHRQMAEVRLLLASGNIDRATAALADDVGELSPEVRGAAVQCAIVGHDLSRARRLLDGWPPEGEPRARRERELWTAIMYAESGLRTRALQRASTVVADATAAGHVRLLLDAGRPAERLLRALWHAAPTPQVRHLVHVAETAPDLSMSHGLSERELEVVRFLPTRLSTAEIAQQLYISLNTLKTHLRTIYRKLEVDGRREASRRAQDLGIA
jgi:LuxR family maltose regulon positive regulatory protein